MLVLTMVGSASVNEAESGNKTAKSGKAHHWFQIGQASWYGGKFQGRKTANGEVFNMNNLTCAHRSLPMNSWVRVTNLKNHRFVFVRVNDRGPVPDNRVVDLSYAAARAVGLRGIGKVKLETVGNGDSEMAQELVAQLRMPLFLTAIR
jgi:rare lipoprotein A